MSIEARIVKRALGNVTENFESVDSKSSLFVKKREYKIDFFTAYNEYLTKKEKKKNCEKIMAKQGLSYNAELKQIKNGEKKVMKEEGFNGMSKEQLEKKAKKDLEKYKKIKNKKFAPNFYIERVEKKYHDAEDILYLTKNWDRVKNFNNEFIRPEYDFDKKELETAEKHMVSAIDYNYEKNKINYKKLLSNFCKAENNLNKNSSIDEVISAKAIQTVAEEIINNFEDDQEFAEIKDRVNKLIEEKEDVEKNKEDLMSACHELETGMTR